MHYCSGNAPWPGNRNVNLNKNTSENVASNKTADKIKLFAEDLVWLKSLIARTFLSLPRVKMRRW